MRQHQPLIGPQPSTQQSKADVVPGLDHHGIEAPQSARIAYEPISEATVQWLPQRWLARLRHNQRARRPGPRTDDREARWSPVRDEAFCNVTLIDEQNLTASGIGHQAATRLELSNNAGHTAGSPHHIRGTFRSRRKAV